MFRLIKPSLTEELDWPLYFHTLYHLTHYWFAAAGIPVVNDIPVMTPTY
jgi:hypothetical protein